MKITSLKLSFLCLIGNFLFAHPILAEFQEITNPTKNADLPTAEFLNNFLYYTNLAIAFVFILFFLILIASGIEFLSAGGDEGSLEKAHKFWRIGVLGIISSLLAYVIVNLIKYFI